MAALSGRSLPARDQPGGYTAPYKNNLHMLTNLIICNYLDIGRHVS
jgi:hypothetical protein